MCSGYPLVSSKLSKILGFKGYLPLTPRSKPELGQPLLSRERAKLRGRGKTEKWDSPLFFRYMVMVWALSSLFFQLSMWEFVTAVEIMPVDPKLDMTEHKWKQPWTLHFPPCGKLEDRLIRIICTLKKNHLFKCRLMCICFSPLSTYFDCY